MLGGSRLSDGVAASASSALPKAVKLHGAVEYKSAVYEDSSGWPRIGDPEATAVWAAGVESSSAPFPVAVMATHSVA